MSSEPVNAYRPPSNVTSEADVSRRNAGLLGVLLIPPAMLAIHLAALIGFFFVNYAIAPQYLAAFEDAEVNLPAAMIQVALLSANIISFWYLWIAAFLVVDVPVLFGLRMLPGRSRWLSYVWFVGVLASVLGATGWILWVLNTTYSSAFPA